MQNAFDLTTFDALHLDGGPIHALCLDTTSSYSVIVVLSHWSKESGSTTGSSGPV